MVHSVVVPDACVSLMPCAVLVVCADNLPLPFPPGRLTCWWATFMAAATTLASDCQVRLPALRLASNHCSDPLFMHTRASCCICVRPSQLSHPPAFAANTIASSFGKVVNQEKASMLRT